MGKNTATLLLIMALALPIVLFWQLGSHHALGGLLAAAVAVAAGWALNVAWAVAARRTAAGDSSHVDGGTLKIAAAFGWACPLVLVFLTWLVLRFFA